MVKPQPKQTDPHYLSPRHRAWRQTVCDRAGWRCEWIDERGQRCAKAAPQHRMFADHKKERQDAPDAELDPTNGWCLCGAHHSLKTAKSARSDCLRDRVKSRALGVRSAKIAPLAKPQSPVSGASCPRWREPATKMTHRRRDSRPLLPLFFASRYPRLEPLHFRFQHEFPVNERLDNRHDGIQLVCCGLPASMSCGTTGVGQYVEVPML